MGEMMGTCLLPCYIWGYIKYSLYDHIQGNTCNVKFFSKLFVSDTEKGTNNDCRNLPTCSALKIFLKLSFLAFT